MITLDKVKFYTGKIEPPKTKEEQTERLNRVLNWILDNPSCHKQNMWHCGTSHCFAGVAQMMARLVPMSTYIKNVSSPMYSDQINDIFRSSFDDARIWLGLSRPWNIFEAVNTIEEIKAAVQKVIDDPNSLDKFQGIYKEFYS